MGKQKKVNDTAVSDNLGIFAEFPNPEQFPIHSIVKKLYISIHTLYK
uniref:Uncharacterized protein n=1 Tax=Anguilla anguilla TaxID=7936 RepID=A0A0E9Q228_ANGAN